jgi:hypothetical protein
MGYEGVCEDKSRVGGNKKGLQRDKNWFEGGKEESVRIRVELEGI